MKIELGVKIVSSLCLAKTVAAADWSWFYSDDDTCAVGKNPQPTDFAVVSPRYDINDNKCLYGEPNRTHVWVPGKTFHGTYCLHMSKLDHCVCSDRTLQFDTYKECKPLPKESFNSYWYTKGSCPSASYCITAAGKSPEVGYLSCDDLAGGFL